MQDVFSVLVPIAGIAGIGAVVFIIVSYVGGWASLAEQYRCAEPFTGPCWRFQNGRFRWLAGYNNCLTVGADPQGLFIGIFPLFRIAHPPLFIPWREISVTRKRVFWIRQVQLILGNELKIPFTIRESLARKLQAAAGSSWPPAADFSH
jgi:hypothetical protein